MALYILRSANRSFSKYSDLPSRGFPPLGHTSPEGSSDVFSLGHTSPGGNFNNTRKTGRFQKKRQLTSRTHNGKIRETHNRQITPKIVLSRIREVLWAKLSWPTINAAYSLTRAAYRRPFPSVLTRNSYFCNLTVVLFFTTRISGALSFGKRNCKRSKA